MPVRPIEVIRAQEATQIKHIDNQKFQHAQEQLSRNYQNNVQNERNKPNQTAKSENHEYRYDAKERGNNQYNSSKKKKDSKEGKKDSKEGKSVQKQGAFDILI
jgi:hypothetical protein